MGNFSGPDPYLTIRTRLFDDALLDAVRTGSIDQVVILAAGMDARAFRLEWPAGVRLFEVDRNDVFTHKEAILARMQARPSCDRRVVEQDLSQSWVSALVHAGFDPRRKTAFLAEGLLHYLDEPAATSLFEVLRGTAAPGSWLGLDTMNPEVLASPFNNASPSLSPDGRWLAYSADESGRTEVYVRSYPGGGGRWQVSLDGGTEPVWSGRGDEIFYRHADDMMAASVRTRPGFEVTGRSLLFSGDYQRGAFREPNFSVSRGGRTFAMLERVVGTGQAIVVTLNLFSRSSSGK